jgi:hypothetical protein
MARRVGPYVQSGHPARTTDPKQRWLTFIHNHAQVIAACDFFVVVTASAEILHYNVTAHRPRNGSCNSSGRRSRTIMRINCSFTTGTAFSPSNWTKR